MDKENKILLVDDNKSVLNSLQLFLGDKFSHIKCLTNPELIPGELKKEDYDLVVLDMNFSAGVNSGNEGLFWMKEVLKHDKDISVVLLTAYGSIDLAVKAVKLGAVDFILKPWENKKFLATLSSALKLRSSVKELNELKQKQKQINKSQCKELDTLEAGSTKMKDLYGQLDKIVQTDVNVLILGESGTGKEVLAKEIHRRSGRREEPFISVDLGALGESVFESELFGHKKGSFTDAKEDRMGRVQVASGGTLFLDEIGNVALAQQAKLLNLIQNRTVTPIGRDHPIPVDIRLICATNQELENMIIEGGFREDLFYRINTIELTIPPLRERLEDILEFAQFFLEKYQAKYLKEDLQFSDDAKQKMSLYPWPGNIRELKHIIERAVILSSSIILYPDDLILADKRKSPTLVKNPTLDNVEKAAVEAALKNNKGNISHTAKELNITRQTLYAKIQKHGL